MFVKTVLERMFAAIKPKGSITVYLKVMFFFFFLTERTSPAEPFLLK